MGGDSTACRAAAPRNVLITGASRGLGRALAVAFWRRGDSLLLVARSGDALREVIRGLPPPGNPQQRAHAVQADLAHAGAPAEVVAQAKGLWDRLDVLINNAAIAGPIGPAWQNDRAAWEQTLRVNLLAPVELCRGGAAWMIPQRAGSIINLSGGGATSPRPNFSAYATAKAGLVRFSETLARELAEFHIRVNAVAPGAMNTAMQRAVLDAGAARAGEKEYQLALEQGRDGGAPPERAAELCLFLASPDAAGISGRLISAVWDDWPALGGRPELAASDIYTLRRIVPEDRGMQW